MYYMPCACIYIYNLTNYNYICTHDFGIILDEWYTMVFGIILDEWYTMVFGIILDEWYTMVCHYFSIYHCCGSMHRCLWFSKPFPAWREILHISRCDTSQESKKSATPDTWETIPRSPWSPSLPYKCVEQNHPQSWYVYAIGSSNIS